MIAETTNWPWNSSNLDTFDQNIISILNWTNLDIISQFSISKLKSYYLFYNVIGTNTHWNFVWYLRIWRIKNKSSDTRLKVRKDDFLVLKTQQYAEQRFGPQSTVLHEISMSTNYHVHQENHDNAKNYRTHTTISNTELLVLHVNWLAIVSYQHYRRSTTN